MGLTVSLKTAKNLAVRRKNERILTVSRKKMLTVKRSSHKIRFRDLLLSLMCYAFMRSGSKKRPFATNDHMVQKSAMLEGKLIIVPALGR